MSPHLLEVTALVLSIGALCASGFLFTLKLSDLTRVKQSKQNGPLLFMARDNVRRQGFTMAVCGGMVMLSISGLNNDGPIVAQTKNLLMGMCVFALLMVAESVFIYRRREKMALLIALYENRPEGVPGGRRASDPPIGEPVA